MLLPILALLCGLALLVWSADRFVDGAAAAARHGGLPPLLIGIVIVGLGTSAPEMVVSTLAALQGNPGLALGNAYGSNITNIALILGLTALLSPITVHSQVLRKELPILVAVTLFAAWQLQDGAVSRPEALLLLAVFAGLMAWTLREGLRGAGDALADETASELAQQGMSLRQALFWLVAGLLLLILASRVLVWGAVSIAQAFGVSDLIIGLTVVAIGTSLPELASSLIAVRKGEHDIALGNVIGSNLFNTLAVVGIAATIEPVAVGAELFRRDVPVMVLLTVSLLLICRGFGGRPGRVSRAEAAGLLACYIGYMGWLGRSVLAA